METQATGSITIEDLPPGSLEAIRELWFELHEHHLSTDPARSAVAQPRTAEQAWRFRRPAVERWLREPDAFALVAREGARPVGFAVATVKEASGAWDVGERMGVLEILAVAEDRRRRGIGTALTREVAARMAAGGVSMVQIEVLAANEMASRFYGRLGAEESSRVYWLPTGDDG
jgi:ribosomal protein S18 acetylase RimI-like enzyme